MHQKHSSFCMSILTRMFGKHFPCVNLMNFQDEMAHSFFLKRRRTGAKVLRTINYINSTLLHIDSILARILHIFYKIDSVQLFCYLFVYLRKICAV